MSRIKQIISSADGTKLYNYDDTNQLTGADKLDSNADETYRYDANGNRLYPNPAQAGSDYATGTNNQLLFDGVYDYTYDAEGNLSSRTKRGTTEVRTFTWDYRNRLTQVSDSGGGTTTYTYDALNQRLAKTVGTQTTRFVYDRGNVYLEFSGTSTTPSTRYLYGPMVDQVLAQESQGNTTWMLADHLGSVRDLVNNSGAVVNHFTYDSFGQVVSSMAGATVDTRYKFTGREYDSETGLYYYRARYFDAGVGRFIGQDPMGFGAGDSNLYRYVGNDPINFIDPSGHKKVFRGMQAVGNLPLVGRSARALGIRPGTDVDVEERREQPNCPAKLWVIHNQKGMSVAPDSPFNLPSHRRPPAFGGTGKDPVWSIGASTLGLGIIDSIWIEYYEDRPGIHGVIRPRQDMLLEVYEAALAGTQNNWSKEDPSQWTQG